MALWPTGTRESHGEGSEGKNRSVSCGLTIRTGVLVSATKCSVLSHRARCRCGRCE